MYRLFVLMFTFHLCPFYRSKSSHAYFTNEYLKNDGRYEKLYNCSQLQIGNHVLAFDRHIYVLTHSKYQVNVMHIPNASRKRWQINNNYYFHQIWNYIRVFYWRIYIWPWPILKVIVKVMHILTENSLEMVTGVANITTVINYIVMGLRLIYLRLT